MKKTKIGKKTNWLLVVLILLLGVVMGALILSKGKFKRSDEEKLKTSISEKNQEVRPRGENWEVRSESTGRIARVEYSDEMMPGDNSAFEPWPHEKLVLNFNDKEIELYKTNTTSGWYQLHVNDLLFSPNGRYLMVSKSGFEAADFQIIDLETKEDILKKTDYELLIGDVDDVFWNEEYAVLVSNHSDFTGYGNLGVFVFDPVNEVKIQPIFVIEPAASSSFQMGNVWFIDPEVFVFDFSDYSKGLISSFVYNRKYQTLDTYEK